MKKNRSIICINLVSLAVLFPLSLYGGTPKIKVENESKYTVYVALYEYQCCKERSVKKNKDKQHITGKSVYALRETKNIKIKKGKRVKLNFSEGKSCYNKKHSIISVTNLLLCHSNKKGVSWNRKLNIDEDNVKFNVTTINQLLLLVTRKPHKLLKKFDLRDDKILPRDPHLRMLWNSITKRAIVENGKVLSLGYYVDMVQAWSEKKVNKLKLYRKFSI